MIASKASAATGKASFMNMFHTPVRVISSPIWDRVNPHDRNTSVMTPSEMIPPAGTTSAIVVPIWLFTAAWASVSPGIAAIVCHQYVNRLKAIAAVTPTSSSGLSLVRVFHTDE